MGIPSDEDQVSYVASEDQQAPPALFFPQDDTVSDDQVGDTWNFWKNLIIKSPPEIANLSVAKLFENQNWDNPHFIRSLETNWKNGEYQVWCSLPGRIPVQLKKTFYRYPKFEPYHPKEDTSCSKPTIVGNEKDDQNISSDTHPVTSMSSLQLVSWTFSIVLCIPITAITLLS